MTKFLAAILSVIAVGVLLIAYGLLSPRAAAFGPAEWQGMPGYQIAIGPGGVQTLVPTGSVQSMLASGAYQLVPVSSQAGQYPMVYGTRTSQPVYVDEASRPVARRTTVIRRDPGRNWKKTALLVGGSTATGAGVGAIFGGKRGALIGAAIGGGASSIFEAAKR